MKFNLLYPDRENINAKTYPDPHIITADMHLTLVFEQAGRDNGDASGKSTKDSYISETMKKVMLCPILTEEELLYRQNIIKEAIKHEKLLESLYDISTRSEKTVSEYLQGGDKLKSGSIAIIEKIKFLRQVILYSKEIKAAIEEDRPGGIFFEAFKDLYEELDDEFVTATESILDDLDFLTSGGQVILRTGVITGLKAESFYIEKLEALEFKERKKQYSAAMTKLKGIANAIVNPDVKELKDETLISDARALEEGAAEYIMSFYEEFIKSSIACLKNLKPQAAFLLGCKRLYDRFERANVPMCFPELCDRTDIEFEDLCETCLCIYNRKKPVGNDINAQNTNTFIITGANQGGKSTYLKSIGIAQVFMQAGMFVTAKKYRSGLYKNIFTHFTRREDTSMNSGRLDEELKRMSQIVDRLTPDSMLLLNESFATTTEKEGSQIAMELTEELLKTDIRTFSVTHLLEYANEAYEKYSDKIVFLSAGRRPDGTRSYKIRPNRPENTSYGLDLYDELVKM